MSMATQDLDVSRETMDRLKIYLDLLTRWNQKINLVSPDTLKDAWSRHFVDSAQIVRLAPESPSSWVDIGSGGGFPGLVAAAILKEDAPECHVSLIESDQRKCAFLRTASREMGLTTTVTPDRIESAPARNAEILSARALAPLDRLLSYSARHLSSTGTALLMKGRSWEKEVAEAQKQWNFSMTAHSSSTDPEAVVLEIRDIEHV